MIVSIPAQKNSIQMGPLASVVINSDLNLSLKQTVRVTVLNVKLMDVKFVRMTMRLLIKNAH